MSAQPQEDADDIEWEIADLVAEHGSERAALRAVLHDFDALLMDAYNSTSRGYLRGVPRQDDESEAGES